MYCIHVYNILYTSEHFVCVCVCVCVCVQVKEKEQAHREYREAISKGHGAYLMDEETPVHTYIHYTLYTHVYIYIHTYTAYVHMHSEYTGNLSIRTHSDSGHLHKQGNFLAKCT